MKPSIKSIASAIILLLIFASCSKQKRNQYVSYEGHVYYKSGAPAANVAVVLEACGGGPGDKQHQCTGNKFTIKKTVTDSDGHFYIHEKASRIDVYFVTIDSSYNNSDGVSAGTLKDDRFTNVHLSY
ncbi:MAG: hypothetical protein HY062_17840 [Bacteroidetes bacterium]|nr:hypothetical protein [Bacteroidota bacterium]